MKVDILVPNSLEEITLKQYQKFLKIQKENDDPYFLQCKMIEIFCNLDSKAVRNLKLLDADKIVSVIKKADYEIFIRTLDVCSKNENVAKKIY